MTKPPRIPWPVGCARLLNGALIAAAALHRTALIHVRAGFENSPDPRAVLVADSDRKSEIIANRDEEIRILRSRLSRLAPCQRPHYGSEDRFAILKLRAKSGWSAAETARRFLVTPTTIAGWTRRVDEKGEDALVRPPTPVNRHSDRVALLVKDLYAASDLGRRKIAEILAHAGLVISASTVARLRKRRIASPPPEPPGHGEAEHTSEPDAPSSKGDASAPRIVQAKYAHHLWHVDITCIATAGGHFLPWWPFSLFTRWPFSWHIALVLDHFSRSLVAFAVFKKEPTARQICRLLDKAVAAAGKAPRHLVTDQGAQFKSEYRDWCTRKGVKPRFGAIGQHGSIAVIERFIRSLKHEYLHKILVPFSRARMVADLAAYQRWYNDHRPHDALGGATPREHDGRTVPQPRTRFETRPRYPSPAGDPFVRRCERLELVITHVDGRAHLPVVELREAA